MNSMNLAGETQPCGASLITVMLVATMVIRTATCAPADTTYGRAELSADRPQLLLWVDQRMPELENEMFDSGNDPGSTVVRTKRIGSLSIVNSLDVLRQRVLLELARRKALQDQRQIDANRRILESIGKRSVQRIYNGDIAKDLITRNALEYALEQQDQNRGQSLGSGRIPERTQDWLEGGEMSDKENKINRAGYDLSS